MANVATTAQLTKAKWGDLAELAAIQRASFRRDLAYKRWMLAFFWLTPGVNFNVARHGETITGSIIADIHRGRVRIMNIAVHPDYRHRGIGTMLMQAALDAHPDKSVVLMVQEHNTAAQELYKQLGFTRSGFSASYYGSGNAGIEMTLTRP